MSNMWIFQVSRWLKAVIQGFKFEKKTKQSVTWSFYDFFEWICEIMVDNLSRGGDPGRPPQALSPARAQPGPQEAPYLGIGKIFWHYKKYKGPKILLSFNMIINFQRMYFNFSDILWKFLYCKCSVHRVQNQINSSVFVRRSKQFDENFQLNWSLIK